MLRPRSEEPRAVEEVGPDDEVVADLVARWEDVMSAYVPWRTRFEVDLLAVVEGLTGPLTSVLDVGSGPGGFLRRVTARRPRCRTVAMDGDGAVVALARRHLGEGAVVLRDDALAPGWAARATAGAPFDLVLVSALMHIMGTHRYQDVMTEALRAVRPGGVLVDIDEMPLSPSSPLLASQAADQREAEVQERLRNGCEGYRQWRQALMGTFPGYAVVPVPTEEVSVPTADERVAALRAAGFREAAVVLRQLDTAVVLALR